MFDLGFSEMLLTGVVALVVLGPERLPKVARAAGLWLGRLQRFVSGVKNELSRQMDAEGLSEVKEDFQAAVREAQEGLRDARHALQSQAEDVDPELPAWERLPPQRTPADFGIGTDDGLHAGGTRYDDAVPFHMVTLRRQAMGRRRDLRPRFHPRPQLRVRRQGRLKR